MTRPVWPIVVLLMVIGLAARLINLGSGLWFDEIVTLVKYVRSPVKDLLTTCTDFNNQMLFTLAAKVSTGLFGESPWALRLPAVIFGVACIPALYWFGKRVVERREALLSAALLTVAYHHVWFSQNARGYTGLMFWNLLASALFLDGVRAPKAGTWIAYGAVSAASIWTNLSGGFTVAAHGLVFLAIAVQGLVARRDGRPPALPGARSRWPWIGFLLAALLGAALYAGLVPEMMHELGKQSGISSANVKVRDWTNPVWTIREAVRQTGLGTLPLIGFFAGALLASIGFVSILRRDKVAAAIMALPAPVALALLLVLAFHIWPRYFFPLFGFLLIFFVRGVGVVAGALAGRAAPKVATAALVLIAIGLCFMLPADWNLPKQDYEGARDFVVATKAPGEPVVTAGMAAIAYQWHYAKDWPSVQDAPALDRIAAGAPRTWVVYSFPTVLKASHPDVWDRLQSRFETVREFPGTVGDGTVFVARSR